LYLLSGSIRAFNMSGKFRLSEQNRLGLPGDEKRRLIGVRW
jgi:hypothetical protein